MLRRPLGQGRADFAIKSRLKNGLPENRAALFFFAVFSAASVFPVDTETIKCSDVVTLIQKALNQYGTFRTLFQQVRCGRIRGLVVTEIKNISIEGRN